MRRKSIAVVSELLFLFRKHIYLTFCCDFVWSFVIFIALDYIAVNKILHFLKLFWEKNVKHFQYYTGISFIVIIMIIAFLRLMISLDW